MEAARSTYNQNTSHYSKEYYLKDCAGASNFRPGQESDHLLYKYIFDIIGINVKGKKILDLGCGRGELCLSSARKGASKVVGVDFSKDAIELANQNKNSDLTLKRQNIQFRIGDALNLNLFEEFDFIFLTDIVEHLYDDQLELLYKNVHKHLKNDGRVIIHTMPTKEFIYFGQWVKVLFNLLKFKKTNILSFEDQAKITHVNLQHKEQLIKSMKGFDVKAWYDFSERGFLKRLVSKFFFVRVISSNLWAIGKKSKSHI